MFRFALLLFVLCLTVVFSIQTAHAENVQIEGATTAALKLYVDSGSPATSPTLGMLRFFGNDVSDSKVEYARIGGEIANAAVNGAGRLLARVADEGALMTILTISTAGLTVDGDIQAADSGGVGIKGSTGDLGVWVGDNGKVGIGTNSLYSYPVVQMSRGSSGASNAHSNADFVMESDYFTVLNLLAPDSGWELDTLWGRVRPGRGRTDVL